MRDVLLGNLKAWFEGVLIAVFIGFGLIIAAAIFEAAILENIFQIYVFVVPIIILGRSICFIFKNVILCDKFAGEKVGYFLFLIVEIIIVLWSAYFVFISLLVMVLD